MKKMKKFLALMLALMLVLSLCACGQSGQDENPTDPTDGNTDTTDGTEKDPTQESTEATIPEGMAQYKVKVVDEEGNPVVGVMIQVCTEETCLIPVKTDDAGVATFPPAVEGEYHANFLPGIPEGYEADADVFYFADGETELTIQLKAVSATEEN
ncbi:MAG: hypothetical protein IJB47_00095 [Oscillospiraceae bacterium]|nr:hypothetical protein [Oscillospiraceae bacterium]